MVDVYGIFSRVDIHHFPWECYGEIGSKTMDASWEMLQKKKLGKFSDRKGLRFVGKVWNSATRQWLAKKVV